MSDNPFFTTEEQPPAQPAGEPDAQPQDANVNPFPRHADLMAGGFTGEADFPPEEPKQPAGPGDATPTAPGTAPPPADPRLLAPLGYPAQLGGAIYPSVYGATQPPMAQPPSPAGVPPAQPAAGIAPLEALTLTLDPDALEEADQKTLKNIVDHVNKVLERVNEVDTRHGEFRTKYQEEQFQQAKDEEYQDMLWFDRQVQALPEAFEGTLGQGSMAALMPGCPQAQYRNHLWGHYNNLLNSYPTMPEEQVFQYAIQFAFPGHNGNQEAQELKTQLKTRARSGQPQPTRARRATAPKQFGDQAALDFVQREFGDQLVPT